MSGGNHFHFGDSITISGGNHVTGMVKHQYVSGTADHQAALQDVLHAALGLRRHLSGGELRAIDASLREIGTGENVPPGQLRRALDAMGRVATLAGEAGGPVLTAIHRLKELLRS